MGTLSKLWQKTSPSDYLRASDFDDDWHLAVTIHKIAAEELDGAQKVAVTFEELDQRLLLNKTLKSWLTANVGDDLDDLLGSTVELFRTTCDFKGDTVPAIRMRKVQSKSKRKQRHEDDPDDDSTPF